MANPVLTEQSAAAGLAALGNVTRLRLFRLLVRAGRQGLTVGAIQKHLDIPASTLSHHIATLVKAGLVEQEKQGREIICRTVHLMAQALSDYLTEQCCQGVDGEIGRCDVA